VTYCWRLPYVARQWWFYLYIHETWSQKFFKSARKQNDAVRLPNFPTERRHRPRPPPPLRLARRPPGVPSRPPRAPHRRPRGPRPFSSWTAAGFRKGAAPSPVDRRRAVVRGRLADRRPPPRVPPPLFPTRMTSSSPPAASLTAGQESTPTPPPPPTAPPPPPPPPTPLATDTSSPHRSARMEAGDGVGGAATTAPTWLVFFLFFQNAITCVKNVDK
jgi:hypothetical protein